MPDLERGEGNTDAPEVEEREVRKERTTSSLDMRPLNRSGVQAG